MADISNTTVFTNGSSVSCGTSDLLRQAFQEVVDEDDQENEFVAYLQGDGGGSPTIHLTHAQASALRLTFEVDTVDDERNGDITYENDESALLDEITRSTGLENGENSSSCPSVPLESINFQNNDNPVKVECRNIEWTSSEQTRDESHENETISIDDLDITRTDDTARRQLLEQLADSETRPKIYLTSQHNLKPAVEASSAERKDVCYAQESKQSYAKGERSDSQAQILQRLPVLLPSSQYVGKPAQTLLKSAKTIRILPGTSKIGTLSLTNGFRQNSSPQNGSISSQNSILLPKGAFLNTITPRLVNATPVTTQLINGGTISAQLLNASQVLATTCEFTNQNVCSNSANVLRSTSKVGTGVPLMPTLKAAPAIIRAANNQQFMVPALKTNQEAGGVVKGVQMTNGSVVKPVMPGSFLKSVQIPAQLLRNAATAFVKTVPTSTTKIATSTGSPIILRTASLLKAQDTKSVASPCASSILRPTNQTPSNPISILKPQAKIIAQAKNNKRGMLVNGQNVVTRLAHNLNPSSVLPRTNNCAQNNTTERTKTVQNGAIEKRNEASTTTAAKVIKRAKVAGLQSPVALTAEQTDTTKPLGSSENPIQIVQQGHTFHSMQRLTQSQLKQIAHVLQQRSQEAAMPNERIVYRVVFPEELDLRMRNPGNLLKGRGAKRGRPKKTAVRPPAPATKISAATEEEHDDTKDDRKKVIARTRSGRLSRPPRHMVRDYKHLHHLDFMQPDLDDSDGGYSDYNTNAEKLENDAPSSKELLSGLEVPKRKISDHFRCPTCNKIYLGRTRMARHFEMHPDHGSPEQLPPPTPDPELKRATLVPDPLKRKGKKRGPWAYVTPEAKSERRQSKLKEAISVCENLEIVKIAAKPVLNAQSMLDLLILKSDHNVRNFLGELKNLVEKIREQAGTMLSVASDAENENEDLVNLNEESLCGVLGLDPGLYRINNEAFKKPEDIFDELNTSAEEPPTKLQKTHNTDESKEHFEERMSSGFSESSDLSVSDFLNERKNDSHANCPEVLMALTLMPRIPSPGETTECPKSVSKLLISNPEIQNQLSENQGFQKIDINSSKSQSYRKVDSAKDGYAKLADSLDLNGCTSVFDKLNYEEAKQSLPTMDTLQQAFIKLEPIEQGFKLENTTVSSYPKDATQQNYDKIENGYGNIETGSQNFVKGFHKLITKVVAPINGNEIPVTNPSESRLNGDEQEKMLVDADMCKMPESLPILQDSVPIMSNSCDTGSIFGGTDNLDIAKITGYDHIPNLDILTGGGVMDKHMMMDEKLVEQLHLVDQSNLVDELVSERLKNIMPDTILDNNLMPNGPNLDADLDFEALSEEFNRNTRS